ncbi:LacI family DNA-binding transcriptional regulator [Brachybacterium sp. DNPG3]
MATMTDIAREAGVSLSTVSYALSGKRPISDATRQRVQAAIERLSYHPTAAARALALQKTQMLGVAVPQNEDVDDHVIMEFVSSILSAAHEHDYDILLVAAEDHARTLRVVDEGKVDAMIVMDLVEDDPRVASLAKLTRPVVLIGYPRASGGLARVDFDFLLGAQTAVSELVERGAERIAFVTSPYSEDGRVPTYARRSRLGYALACRELDLEEHILEIGASPEDSLALVRDELLDGNRFDGLVVHHEPALPHLGRAVATLGADVPGDVQVVAIAPEDVAVNGPWSVSGIDLPIATIGRSAVTMILEQIDDPGTVPHSRLLSPRFIARGTTRG